MALLLNVGEEPRYVRPASGAAFSLAELQAFVGGYIEAVYLPGGVVMLVNEEGKLEGLPYNEPATALYGAGDPIAGNAIVCSMAEMGEDEEEE